MPDTGRRRKVRRRLSTLATDARNSGNAQLGDPEAALPVGTLVSATLLTFSAANLCVLTSPWLLDSCSSDRGWRHPHG